MSFKFKFIITIISLIIIAFLGVAIISKGERYVTVLKFNQDIINFESGDYFKIRGKINYAQDIGLDSSLYIDNSQNSAVFNLYDLEDLDKDQFIRVLYIENPKAELFGPAIINKQALVSGRFLKDTTVRFNGKDLVLKNLLVSEKMQTKCDSKYENN